MEQKLNGVKVKTDICTGIVHDAQWVMNTPGASLPSYASHEALFSPIILQRPKCVARRRSNKPLQRLELETS